MVSDLRLISLLALNSMMSYKNISIVNRITAKLFDDQFERKLAVTMGGFWVERSVSAPWDTGCLLLPAMPVEIR